MRTGLRDFFHYCMQNQLPLAVYRLPGQKQIKVIAQKHSTLKDITKTNDKGFLFAPFVENKRFKKIIIKPEIFCIDDDLPLLNFAPVKAEGSVMQAGKIKLRNVGKPEYLKYVKKIRSKIGNGNFKKVVAARVSLKKRPDDFEVCSYFKKLCNHYPGAFVSLVYTPQYGLWIGASPEILLRSDKSGFTTYSLAGTKANTQQNKKLPWGKKELEEQKIVSDYILNSFQALKVPPQIIGPETISAGNLLHLRSTFVFKSMPVSQWQAVVNKLHPTPAVAGIPKKKAVDFILKNEKNQRSFYCGYLGPVNLENEINLYVNLRCMQVLNKKLAVYVGCGITADSKPVEEWKESKMKAETLLGILKAEK
jgi:isochorismate synthase